MTPVHRSPAADVLAFDLGEEMLLDGELELNAGGETRALHLKFARNRLRAPYIRPQGWGFIFSAHRRLPGNAALIIRKTGLPPGPWKDPCTASRLQPKGLGR
jgi:hypothetical protein